MILQLPWFDVAVQRSIAHPAKLLRYVYAAGSGHDCESHLVRRVDERSAIGGAA